MYLLQKKSFT